jgi:DNA-binding MarR family transcriptional regulator
MNQGELHGALHQLAHNLRARSDGRAGQGRLLGILLENDGITQRELQEIVGVRSGSLSEVLGKLEAAALIERRESDADRRMMRVFLTERGADEARTSADQRAKTMDELFGCLTDAEKAQLLSLVKRVNEHIEKTAPAGGGFNDMRCRKGKRGDREDGRGRGGHHRGGPIGRGNRHE